jgi:TAG lipase/lysophosphatidylethanolamine acyltransferase
MADGALKVLWSIACGIWEVAFFWQLVCVPVIMPISRSVLDATLDGMLTCLKRLWAWWTQKSKRDQLLDIISKARLFEEWEAAAYGIDECMDYDMWYAFRLLPFKPEHVMNQRALTRITLGDRALRANTTTTV